jgi:hypothetical protein
LIVSEPVLEVVNCLKERQNGVYRVVGAAFSTGIHGAYITEAAVNARPMRLPTLA